MPVSDGLMPDTSAPPSSSRRSARPDDASQRTHQPAAAAAAAAGERCKPPAMRAPYPTSASGRVLPCIHRCHTCVARISDNSDGLPSRTSTVVPSYVDGAGGGLMALTTTTKRLRWKDIKNSKASRERKSQWTGRDQADLSSSADSEGSIIQQREGTLSRRITRRTATSRRPAAAGPTTKTMFRDMYFTTHQRPGDAVSPENGAILENAAESINSPPRRQDPRERVRQLLETPGMAWNDKADLRETAEVIVCLEELAERRRSASCEMDMQRERLASHPPTPKANGPLAFADLAAALEASGVKISRKDVLLHSFDAAVAKRIITYGAEPAGAAGLRELEAGKVTVRNAGVVSAVLPVSMPVVAAQCRRADMFDALIKRDAPAMKRFGETVATLSTLRKTDSLLPKHSWLGSNEDNLKSSMGSNSSRSRSRAGLSAGLEGIGSIFIADMAKVEDRLKSMKHSSDSKGRQGRRQAAIAPSACGFQRSQNQARGSTPILGRTRWAY